MKILNKIVNKLSHKTSGLLSQPPMERVSLKQLPDSVHISTKMTKLQKLKSMLIGLDHNTVKRLESASFHDFVVESRDIILKHKKIPDTLYPNVTWHNEALQLDKMKLDANFDFNAYQVNLLSSDVKASRAAVFSKLRHELEHTSQCIDIYRTEGLGEQFAKRLADTECSVNTQNFIDVFGGKTEEELIPLLGENYTPEIKLLIEKLNTAISKGDDELCHFKNELYYADYPVYLEKYETMRKTITAEMPIIKADSKSAKVSWKHFAEIFNNKGSYKHQMNMTMEKAAYGEGSLAYCEYLFKKFFN